MKREIMDMTTAQLKEFLAQGREVELSYRGHPYFIAPVFLNNVFSNAYYIYDNLAKGVVFTGCLHDVLAYEFSSNVSFEKTIEAFDFEYIL